MATTILSSMNMKSMIAQPFEAASDAQVTLCKSTVDFLNAFCLDPCGNVRTTTLTVEVEDPSGNTRPGDPSGNKVSKRSMVVPMIALLNVPAFQMQKVTVDLLIKIESQSRNDSSENLAYGVGLSASGKVGPIEGKIEANVSGGSSKAKSDSESTSIIYDVHMEAENKPPRGLDMILTWLTGVAPASDTTKKQGPIPRLG
jgi:hypothetical protein